MKTILLTILLMLAPLTAAWAQSRATLSYQSGQSWLQLDYQLSAPVREFRFEPNNARQRALGWQRTSPEWNFDGISVGRSDGAAFDAFSLRLSSPPAPLLLVPPLQNQLLYFGPANYVSTGAVTLVAGEEIPDWLRAGAVNSISAVVDTLSEKFSTMLQRTPTLLLTAGQQSQGSAEKGSTYADGILAGQP